LRPGQLGASGAEDEERLMATAIRTENLSKSFGQTKGLDLDIRGQVPSLARRFTMEFDITART
jgi:hypothetical protein